MCTEEEYRTRAKSARENAARTKGSKGQGFGKGDEDVKKHKKAAVLISIGFSFIVLRWPALLRGSLTRRLLPKKETCNDPFTRASRTIPPKCRLQGAKKRGAKEKFAPFGFLPKNSLSLGQ